MHRQRRKFPRGALATIAELDVAAARRYWPDQGLINACRGALPQRLLYINAGCANNMPERIDDNHVERMRNLLDDLPRGWLAFSRLCASSHAIQPEATYPSRIRRKRNPQPINQENLSFC